MSRRRKQEVNYDSLVAQERLILDATELMYELMERTGVSKSELARRTGRTRGYLTQLLAGERNMTLRTLAELSHALGHSLHLDASPGLRRRDEPPIRAMELSGQGFGEGFWRTLFLAQTCSYFDAMRTNLQASESLAFEAAEWASLSTFVFPSELIRDIGSEDEDEALPVGDLVA